MSEASRWLRLPPVFDLGRLRADLDTALARHWQAHYNDRAHRGSWTSIALRSASGADGDIQAREDTDFSDTGLFACCPCFREVLDSFECGKKAVRLHIPIVTRLHPQRVAAGAVRA